MIIHFCDISSLIITYYVNHKILIITVDKNTYLSEILFLHINACQGFVSKTTKEPETKAHEYIV